MNILIWTFGYGEDTTQNINIKFIPDKGIVYSINANSTNRAVIDLGFFNDKDTNATVPLGRVEVTIKMKDESGTCRLGSDTAGSGLGALEIQSINLTKLKATEGIVYKDPTPTEFTNNSRVGSATLKIEGPIEIIRTEGQQIGDTVLFGCGENGSTVTLFSYSFRLVLEIRDISPSSMVGISPVKEEGEVKLNIRDIVLEQLTKSK